MLDSIAVLGMSELFIDFTKYLLRKLEELVCVILHRGQSPMVSLATIAFEVDVQLVDYLVPDVEDRLQG